MLKIMLIGSSGYIGSRFYFEHCKKYKITNVDFNLFYDVNSSIKEDFSNLSKSFINKHDVIILLAGHSSIGMSSGDMLPVIENNFINYYLYNIFIINSYICNYYYTVYLLTIIL